MRRPRVLYFSHGLTVHDARFLAALVSRFETFFLRLHPERAASAELPAGVETVDGELHDVLAHVRPDVVQAGPIQTCAYLVAKAGFSPLLAVSWGSDLIADADKFPEETAFALNHATLVLCDANQVCDKARELGVPDERFLQLPWGTDLDQFFAGPLRNGKTFLSTRSWEPLYGIDTMLEAFRRAHAQDADARLVLLGGGSQAPMVHAFLDEHQLRDAVVLAGHASRAELPQVFRDADFYVSCSHSDGTSVSLLEAQASGLPVIVSDLPSNREWVTPDVHGWLAPAGDAGAFAEAFRKALALTPEERERIAKTNRAQAEARADWREHARRMLDAIERLAGDHRQ